MSEHGDGPLGAEVVAARDLTRRYGEGATAVDALRGVSLDVRKGQLLAVMGPSGSGKSTLMHILAGLDQPTGGRVSLAGTDLTELGDTELTKLRRARIGFVFQFFNLLPMLTAEENLLVPLRIAGREPDADWYAELIRKVGLADRLTHRPSELSGVQQQRVAIARALVSQPTIVFAVVLGVAMVSGTYVLTDTISHAFDTIFTSSYKNTSAVIAGKQVVKDA